MQISKVLNYNYITSEYRQPTIIIIQLGNNGKLNPTQEVYNNNTYYYKKICTYEMNRFPLHFYNFHPLTFSWQTIGDISKS